jgi:hypothetical protein
VLKSQAASLTLHQLLNFVGLLEAAENDQDRIQVSVVDGLDKFSAFIIQASADIVCINFLIPYPQSFP